MTFPFDLIGVPWAEGGRDPRPHDGGCDCLGIVLAGLERMGHRVIDPWNTVLQMKWQDKDGRDVVAEMPAAEWRQVEKDDASPGDVLVTSRGQHLSLVVTSWLVLTSRRRAGSHLLQLRRFLPFVESVWRRR